MTSPERYAATARVAARSILGAPPFVVRPRAPGTLRRLADDVGHGVVAVVHWVASLLGRLFAHPLGHAAHAVFGSYGTPALIAIGVLAVVVLALAWVRRSRPGRDASDGGVATAARQRRSEALLARASAARAAGDLDVALRLRFEAGLEQLEARGVVRDRASLTTSALAAQVASSTFDELASVHTLVAYAGVPASGDDVDAAFERWPELASARGVLAGAR